MRSGRGSPAEQERISADAELLGDYVSLQKSLGVGGGGGYLALHI